MSEQSSVYTAYQGNSYLFGGNAPYVEEMYENYLANPTSVPDIWRDYFDALQNVPAVDGSNAKPTATSWRKVLSFADERAGTASPRLPQNDRKTWMTSSRPAVSATGSHGVLAIPAAMKTLPQTGGVMVQRSAYQKTKRCACSAGRPSFSSAGPATEMQMM